MTLRSVAAACVISLISLISNAAEPINTEPQIIELIVNEKGFSPNVVQADPGKPVILKVTRKTKDTCATSIEIPAKKIKRKLPLNKTVTIKIGVLERGEIKFGCTMNMMENGIIYVK